MTKSLDPSIAEINLLGTGGVYGESLLIHIGNEEWIVIDSCINPKTNDILPLELIKQKTIKPHQIKYIICTHWHDDHIKGISNIFEYAVEAELVFARVNDPVKFFQILGIDYEKVDYYATNISTKEFNNCIDLLKERDKIFIDASVDRNIYSSTYLTEAIDIYSLSPSDYSSLLFDEDLSRLMSEFIDTNKKIPYTNPNHRSVVLLLKLGQHYIILGSDLELIKNDNRLGWRHIIDSSQVFKKIDNPNYIKIPHHGSENGFVVELWDQKIANNITSSLTPWKLGNNELPTQAMLNKYKSYTDELYMTSSPKQSDKPKDRNHVNEKAIKRFNESISELRFNYGIVESRVDITDKNATWSTNMYGTAFKIQ